MPDFFIILLKINLVLLLFAVAYYLILRRLTFYVINRGFLVFGILFASLYPFIDLTAFFNQQNQQFVAFVPELNQKVKTIVPLDFISNYWLWITILFYAGVIFMAFRLVGQFVSLYRMHQKSSPGAIANFKVRILDEPVSPFSFWQTVYINPTLHKERELQTILTHEQIHVQQWHSLDIILAELSTVFYWFNPGVWLMKRAVKENLEFITDQKILNKGVDKKTYQYSLLDVGNLIPAVEIVNNFNLSDLKKRIQMMNAKRSSKLTLSRYMLVLPVLLLTTLAFTVSKKDIKKHLNPIALALEKAVSKNISPSVIDIPLNTIESVSAKKNNLKTGKKIQATKLILNFKDTVNDEMNDVTKALLIQMATQRAQKGDTAKLSIRTIHGMDLNDKQAAFILNKTEEISRSISYNGDKKLIYTVGVEYKGKTADQGIKPEVIIVANRTSKALDIKVPQTTIVLRGYKAGTAITDSSKYNKVDYYYYDKKITEEMLSKIDPNTIESVKVKKGNPLSEVIIIGKKIKP